MRSGVDIRELRPGDEEILHRALRTFKDAAAAVPDLFLEEPRAHAFVALARSKGHQKMWLLTDAGNEAARRLYERAGGDPTEKLGYWWVFG